MGDRSSRILFPVPTKTVATRWTCWCPLGLTRNSPATKGLWRNGSASDSRSAGWGLGSLWPHFSFRDAAVMQGFLLFNALLLPLPWQCHVTMACQRSQAPSLCGTSQCQDKSYRIPHPSDPGSIPGGGIFLTAIFSFRSRILN